MAKVSTSFQLLIDSLIFMLDFAILYNDENADPNVAFVHSSQEIDEKMKIMGRWIKGLRILSGLSLERLAELSDISPSCIVKMTSRGSIPSKNRYARLRIALEWNALVHADSLQLMTIDRIIDNPKPNDLKLLRSGRVAYIIDSYRDYRNMSSIPLQNALTRALFTETDFTSELPKYQEAVKTILKFTSGDIYPQNSKIYETFIKGFADGRTIHYKSE